jgi:prepilin-type N-terminal cleavage/methylation domain-containing protein
MVLRRTIRNIAHHARVRRGFTLVEALIAIMVVGIIAALAFPLLHTSANGLASATSTARTIDRCTYAIDRITRELREGEVDGATGEMLLQTADVDHVRFQSGRGFELDAGTLYLHDDAGNRAPLVDGVETFLVRYIAQDGTTDTRSTPELTQRFEVQLRVGGLTLSTAALPRARMVAP